MRSKLVKLWMSSPFVSDVAARHYHQREWNKENMHPSTTSLKDILHGFKYIVEVDHNKIYDMDEGPHGDILPQKFRRAYCYPYRELGDHVHIMIIRGMYTNDENIFERNEFGLDACFVGTNNPFDATVIALKYS